MSKQNPEAMAAEEYAESCDNESGSFLSKDLIKIRKKAQLVEALGGKPMEESLEIPPAQPADSGEKA